MPGKFTPTSHYHMRRKARGRRTVVGELFRTHSFTVADTSIPTGTVFPDVDRDITVSTTVEITGSANGIVFELGGGTTGLTLVVFSNFAALYYGDTGDGGGVAFTTVLPTTAGARVRLTAAVRPGTGEARLWLNELLVARATSVDGALANGWVSSTNGAVGQVNTSLHPDVPIPNSVTLTGASIVSPVDVFIGQPPRTFD